MPTRRMLVLRHGQTAWNLEGRWQGWLDIELDAVGLEQARRRAEWLAQQDLEFAGVASSPLSRALATAGIVAGNVGIGAVLTYPGLRERNGGDWQGLTRSEIEARWAGEFAAMRSGKLDGAPGGETLRETVARLDDALAAIDRDMPTGPVLVVTHGGIVRALVNRSGGTDDASVFANVGGMWFDYQNGRMRAGPALPPLADDPAIPEGPLPVAPEVLATSSDAVPERN